MQWQMWVSTVTRIKHGDSRQWWGGGGGCQSDGWSREAILRSDTETWVRRKHESSKDPGKGRLKQPWTSLLRERREDREAEAEGRAGVGMVGLAAVTHGGVPLWVLTVWSLDALCAEEWWDPMMCLQDDSRCCGEWTWNWPTRKLLRLLLPKKALVSPNGSRFQGSYQGGVETN